MTPRGGEAVYRETGVAFIRSQNVYNGQFSSAGLVHLAEDHAEQLQGVAVEPGDILLNITGDSVARCCRVPEVVLPARVSQHVAIIRPNAADLDSRFVCHFLISPAMQSTLLSLTGSGGTRKALTKQMVERLEVPRPPRAVQQRIADVLGAYDDLIENNRRRMVLLEDAAQQLHREWFVRLRFPGHEHTRIMDGVPNGWARKALAEVCVPENGIQTGPFGSQLHQSDYTENGVPVVMPKDIIDCRIAVSSIARVPEAVAARLGRHRMEQGDVVYGRRGEIGRRAFVSRWQAGWLCGTGSLRLRPNRDVVVPRFFFQALGAPATCGVIVGRAKGATMPNLNAAIMASVPVLVPPLPLQHHYAENAEPMSAMVEMLAEQNQKLRAARDILLPRLMSGEITV